MEEISASIDFDRRFLYAQDIAASKVYTDVLAARGTISQGKTTAVQRRSAVWRPI